MTMIYETPTIISLPISISCLFSFLAYFIPLVLSYPLMQRASCSEYTILPPRLVPFLVFLHSTAFSECILAITKPQGLIHTDHTHSNIFQ